MTIRLGASCRHLLVCLALVAFSLPSCLIRHDIVGPETALDLPPVITAITPVNDEPFLIDRSSDSTNKTFTLLEVIDPNEDDRIDYEIAELLDIEGPVQRTLPDGILTASLVQDNPDGTVYEPLAITINPCDFFHRSLSTNAVQLRVRLFDRVPPEQRVGDEEGHLVEVSWLIVFKGICPGT